MDEIFKLPITLKDDELPTLIAAAKDYIVCHGVIVRRKDNAACADGPIHAPFTLLPSPVPRRCFEEARCVQRDINTLMHRVAHDYDFLKECLKSAVKVDEFTRNLWNIYETVYHEGKAQPLCLALIRADYMFDYCNSSCSESLDQVHLRQIEINTVAASFAGLSQQLTPYHRYVLERLGAVEKSSNVPVNESSNCLAEGIVTAWRRYGNKSAVVLFLVYANETNIYDQRWLEYAVQAMDPQVVVLRRTFVEMQQRSRLCDDKTLFIDNSEVAVVYQRCCYTPVDFTAGEPAWRTRLAMERSRAVLCPTVGYQLAGTKKVQQLLARPGVVERYITDEAAVRRIRNTFAGQYSLDMDAEGDENVAMAIQTPHKFVLKPQREGGGNNTFGEEVRTVLTKLKASEERSAYVLMERIQPLSFTNYPVRIGQPTALTNVVSELGIFGTLVGTKDEVFLNKQQGHLLRTKPVGTDEGGVATGYSVLDSPYLVD